MIYESILLALLLGWMLRGRIERLADGRIKYVWLIFVPLGMYFLARQANYANVFAESSWVFSLVNVIGIFAIMVFVATNWRIPGAKLMFVGILANLVVILANGGLMPVCKSAAATVYGQKHIREITSGKYVRHTFIHNGTRLAILGDILPGRRPYVLVKSVYSIGDIILSLGGLIAIVAVMRAPGPTEPPIAEEA